MSGISFDFKSFWRFSKQRHNATVAHDSEIVLHTNQRVVVADLKSLGASRVMFAQVFLEFSNLSLCCECRKVVAVSEYTDVFDRMFVETRVEHSNAVIQFLHRPFSVQIKPLCRVLRSIHCAVEHGNS